MEEPDSSLVSDDEYDASVGLDDDDFLSCKNSTSVAEDDFNYEVFSPDQIVQFMNNSIDEVNQILQLPTTTVRILLHHFRWDKEKLMERFFDNDQDAVFREAHIINPHSKVQRQSSSDGKRSKNFCQICFLSCEPSLMTGLLCDHRFCNDCWRHYLRTKIVDEGMGQTIACPGHDCDIYVDDETVMKLIKDPQVLIRYQHLITNSFVECNRLMRWCPAPNCSNAVRVMFFDAKPVRCSCGKVFCFGCGHEWHDPVKCKWLKKWLKKCDDDSETSNWIAANTKECPVCHATIEKNGGCNHVICQNISCRNEFCWVCLGPWKPHGSYWYHCNRFNEDEAKRARDAQERSRSALQRYLHYYNRYINHFQSLKLENKLYKNVRLKMEEMQYQGMSWIEVQFLKKAVDILLSCRQTLMYTYSFAFYLRRNNQSEVFEQNQADLERATEELSGYLERDVSEDAIYKVKQNVQDKYRYCENRRNVLLEHVHEGYEKNYWSYISD